MTFDAKHREPTKEQGPGRWWRAIVAVLDAANLSNGGGDIAAGGHEEDGEWVDSPRGLFDHLASFGKCLGSMFADCGGRQEKIDGRRGFCHEGEWWEPPSDSDTRWRGETVDGEWHQCTSEHGSCIETESSCSCSSDCSGCEEGREGVAKENTVAFLEDMGVETKEEVGETALMYTEEEDELFKANTEMRLMYKRRQAGHWWWCPCGDCLVDTTDFTRPPPRARMTE